MKSSTPIIISLLVFSFNVSFSQDTSIVFTNYKTKVGLKVILDRGSDYSLSNRESRLVSFGFQLIRRIANSKYFLETGIYSLQKVVGEYKRGGVIYKNISVPLLMRIDTKVIYILGGVSFDYLFSKKQTTDSYLSRLGNERKFNLGLNLGLGIEKSVCDELNLFVEARGFNNIISSRENSTQLFESSYLNYGVVIGINLKYLNHKED